MTTEQERIDIPHVGDVIAWAAFENGWRRKDEAKQPIWVTDDATLPPNAYEEIVRDAGRECAAFVVEESGRSDDSVTWTEHRRSGYGGTIVVH